MGFIFKKNHGKGDPLKINESQRHQKEKPLKSELVMQSTKSDFRFNYDKDWEKKSFLDVVRLLDVKAILTTVQNQPIQLANGYAQYLQILSIQGKDIDVLSEQEQIETVAAYTQWLSGTFFSFAEQTTTLPTDTRTQINEFVRCLDEVRYKLLSPNLSDNERIYLNHRQDVLMQNIIALEVVAAEQYNTEFFIWIFADSLAELEGNTRIAQSISLDFRPEIVSAEKKEQILKQYYNSNELV